MEIWIDPTFKAWAPLLGFLYFTALVLIADIAKKG